MSGIILLSKDNVVSSDNHGKVSLLQEVYHNRGDGVQDFQLCHKFHILISKEHCVALSVERAFALDFHAVAFEFALRFVLYAFCNIDELFLYFLLDVLNGILDVSPLSEFYEPRSIFVDVPLSGFHESRDIFGYIALAYFDGREVFAVYVDIPLKLLYAFDNILGEAKESFREIGAGVFKVYDERTGVLCRVE